MNEIDTTGLAVPRLFRCALSRDSQCVTVDVDIHIDASGDVIFNFRKLALSKESLFIVNAWGANKCRPDSFRLAGVSADGIEFETDSFHLSGSGIKSDEYAAQVQIEGGCLTAQFKRSLVDSASLPRYRYHLCGLETFRSSSEACPLGSVHVASLTKVNDRDQISGFIEVAATEPPCDLDAWRASADTLLEHVRRVMSFGSASLLRVQVIELWYGHSLIVTTRSQITGARSLPTIQSMQAEKLFATAVDSYFRPPVEVRQLYFAMEWYCMGSTHLELRLICAMTALENLVEANLRESEAYIEANEDFDRTTRKALRRVVKRCVSSRTPDLAKEVTEELNERLGDLNRRAFLRKVNLLLRRWQVPMGGIPASGLQDAVKARNRVVHQGQYYAGAKPGDADLWWHICVVREVLARAFFVVLGYSGHYVSYVPCPHPAVFPPAAVDKGE